MKKNGTTAVGRTSAIARFALACLLLAPSAAGAGERWTDAIVHAVETGFATYYSAHFEGRRTASGTTFRHEALVAAHPSWPFGTLARVTNLVRGDSVIVRVTDRGPATGPRNRGVIIDLSRAAAERLKMLHKGRMRVDVEVLQWGQGGRPPEALQVASSAVDRRATALVADTLVLRLDLALSDRAPAEMSPSDDCQPESCIELALESTAEGASMQRLKIAVLGDAR